MSVRTTQSGRWRALVLLLLAVTVLVVADWFSGGVTRAWTHGRAEVVVTSEPAGAMVRIDGIVRGATPRSLAVEPGARTIELTHPYHPPHLAHLELARGEVYALDVKLEPAWGSLQVISNPRGAAVLIDDVLQDGATPLTLDPWRAGHYMIEVRSTGRVARTVTAEILPDARTELVLELDRSARGRLLIETVPSRAVAELIDATGKVHPADAILPVGDYILRVRASGYRTVERPHRLLVGERALSVVLERTP